jgi:hypothetical protein
MIINIFLDLDLYTATNIIPLWCILAGSRVLYPDLAFNNRNGPTRSLIGSLGVAPSTGAVRQATANVSDIGSRESRTCSMIEICLTMKGGGQ